jgi:hypothetical protein
VNKFVSHAETERIMCAKKSCVLMLCELPFVLHESSELQGMMHACFVSHLFPVSFSVLTSYTTCLRLHFKVMLLRYSKFTKLK